ncbi:LysR family transcriptional regulator [Salmonella enterica subsp. salamae]|nr:LysR family transcriptional regulator [Salmonella enterica subsp. salamae]ECJ2279346.1 LysR family transcriptional regulator [Salmonella enterica subsp. salamae]HCC0887610.1 LysR family transcriptional regulator [Salmonella enterica]HCC0891009.1 LysR family transcriptional regulator [Salmonella enterica]
MDRLMAMRVLVNVVDLGSLTAAANALNISRSMATRYIAYLEKSVNARLLHRSSRCLTASNAGNELLPFCRRMLEIDEEMQATLISQHTEPQGHLRVACSFAFGQAYLVNAITRFLTRYPQLSVEMVLTEGPVNFVESRIDLAIQISDSPAGTLIARYLGDCASQICAAAAYLAQYGTPSVPTDLKAHNCLVHAQFGNIWEFTASTLQKNSDCVTVAGNFAANDVGVLLQAALAGKGIACLPAFTAAPWIHAGALQPLLADFALPTTPIYALYTSRHYVPLATRCFLDFIHADMHKNNHPPSGQDAP